jgi:hypothetical protein
MSSEQQNSAQPLEALAGLNLALDPAPAPEEEETPPPLLFEDLPQDLRRECLFRAVDDPKQYTVGSPRSILKRVLARISKVSGKKEKNATKPSTSNFWQSSDRSLFQTHFAQVSRALIEPSVVHNSKLKAGLYCRSLALWLERHAATARPALINMDHMLSCNGMKPEGRMYHVLIALESFWHGESIADIAVPVSAPPPTRVDLPELDGGTRTLHMLKGLPPGLIRGKCSLSKHGCRT